MQIGPRSCYRGYISNFYGNILYFYVLPSLELINWVLFKKYKKMQQIQAGQFLLFLINLTLKSLLAFNANKLLEEQKFSW